MAKISKYEQDQAAAAQKYVDDQQRNLKDQETKRQQNERQMQDKQYQEKQLQAMQWQEKQDQLKKDQAAKEQAKKDQQIYDSKQVQKNLESIPKKDRTASYQNIVVTHSKVAETQIEHEAKNRRPDYQRDVQTAKLTNEASRQSQQAYERTRDHVAKQDEFKEQLRNPNLTVEKRKHIELKRDVEMSAYERDTAAKAALVCGIVNDKKDLSKSRMEQEYEKHSAEHDKLAKALDDHEVKNNLGKYALKRETPSQEKKEQDKKQDQIISSEQHKVATSEKNPDQSKQQDQMDPMERRMREKQERASAQSKGVEITPEMQKSAEKCSRQMEAAQQAREQTRERERHSQIEREH